MRETLDLAWNGVLDLVYPPRCLVCGEWIQGGALCAACPKGFLPVQPPFCDRCGEPVPAERMVCEACERGPDPDFEWAQTLGQYAGPLRIAIQRLKYNRKTALARPLGRLLSESLDNPRSPLLYLTDGSPRAPFDVIVPVPLHPRKLRERGFNQAERIARALSELRGWPLDAHGLRRGRYTGTQTALSLTERTANVYGAFAVRTADRFAGKSVLIVDDVITTTATTRECARIVKGTGAARVCIVALARGL